MSAFSRSTELIHSPPDLIRSLVRSVIFMNPFRIDGGDVAGAQPAVVRPLVGQLVRLVIGGGDPGPAHLQLAHGLAVPGHNAGVVHQPACRRRAWRCPASPDSRSACPRRAPSMDDFRIAALPSGVVSVMPQAWMVRTPWRSKPRIIASLAAEPPTAVRSPGSERPAVRLGVQRLEDSVPDRRHAGGERDPLGLGEIEQAHRVEMGAGQDDAGRRPRRRRRAGPRRWRGTSAPPA